MTLREAAKHFNKLADEFGDVDLCIHDNNKGDRSLEEPDINLIGTFNNIAYVVLFKEN